MAIFNIPGAYLNTDIPDDKFILLNSEGKCLDIMCEVNARHKRYLHAENGLKLLYLRLTKALYGCMEYALLWYDLYSKTLEPQGFLINPYDRCVANITI